LFVYLFVYHPHGLHQLALTQDPKRHPSGGSTFLNVGCKSKTVIVEPLKKTHTVSLRRRLEGSAPTYRGLQNPNHRASTRLPDRRPRSYRMTKQSLDQGPHAHPLDRISEVYEGSLWSERLTSIARERIDWMAQQVTGDRILDVGCSQGILSIISARNGHTTTGIDVEPLAIDYARQALKKEPKDVADRIRFQLVSIEKFSDTEKYDTIYLGEVIEHQKNPIDFIATASNHLSSSGRIVVTTPFGYHPHEDHKSTIFPSFIYAAGSIGLHCTCLEVKAGYILAVFEPIAESGATALPAQRILRLTEAGALNAQRRLFDIISQRDKRISALLAEAESGRSRERTLLATLERSLDDAKAANLSLAKAKSSVSYRIGREIVRVFEQPLKLLNLPRALITISRDHRNRPSNRDRNAVSSTSIPAAPLPIGTQTSVFLKKQPRTFRISDIEAPIYQLRGKIMSIGDYQAKGALITISFKDEAQKDIPFESDLFSWQPKKRHAFAYLATDQELQFRCTVVVPARTREIIVGVQRFAEKPPIYCELVILALGENTSEVSDVLNVTSGGSAQSTTYPLKADKPYVASIFDEFTSDCFAPEFSLLPVSRKAWQREIADKELLAFMAESTWRGNGGEWKYAMSKPEKWGKELSDILAWCRSSQVPSVFWNKEDPVNFDVFKNTAKNFEYIFTTDVGSIDRYKELFNHQQVRLLQFAAQPELHNPVRTRPVIDRLAFTGSWRGVKYPKRAEWLDMMLLPAIERQILDLFDRFADEKQNPDLIFPDRFRSALRGALPYDQLVTEVYKGYRAFFNVNSVEDSDTMVARRVFEILACGAPVISSPSPAVEKTFGDAVISVTNRSQVEQAIDQIMYQPLFADRLATKGVRLVHSSHTYKHRAEEISKAIGKPLILRANHKVSIICCSKRPEFLEHVSKQINAQQYRDIEVIFIAHSDEYDLDRVEQAFKGQNLSVLNLPGNKFLADGLNLGIEKASGDLIAKIDDDDYYGPNYLTDSVLAFDYAPNAGVVGKQSFFAYMEDRDQTVHRFPGKSYKFAKRVHGGTLIWAPKRTKDLRFTQVRQGTDSLFLKSCIERQIPILSVDPFNFIHVRYADNNRHTWKIDDEEFIRNAKVVAPNLALDLVYT
jgi:spore maturation protein CgeB/2-polyprenyl-3-methyl-5-hydroxy-6-metoxy-1,4-benzoquinol methylase